MIIKLFVCVLLGLCVFVVLVVVVEFVCVIVCEGWVCLLLGVMLMVVGYGWICNDCLNVVVVVGVGSWVFGDVLLYEIILVNGVSWMCEVGWMLIVLGVMVDLKFGGLYLMLM